jgi:hypothetical protein
MDVMVYLCHFSATYADSWFRLEIWKAYKNESGKRRADLEADTSQYMFVSK